MWISIPIVKIPSVGYLGKIPLTDSQIAGGFSLILLPLRSPDKAEPVRVEADPSDFEPPPRPVV